MHRVSLERQCSTRERVFGVLGVIVVLFLNLGLPAVLIYWCSGEQPKDQAEIQRKNQKTVARLRQDVEQLKQGVEGLSQGVEGLSAGLHPPSADLQPADQHTREKWDRIYHLATDIRKMATDIQEMAYPKTTQAEEDEEESRAYY